MKTRLALALICAVLPLTLNAQETYGTSALTYVSLSAYDFHPLDSTTAYLPDAAGGFYRTSGSPSFEAPLHLPSGSIVTYLEIYGCDNSANSINSYFRNANNGGTWGVVGGPGTSTLNGCGTVNFTISPVTINNASNSYTIEVTLPADTQVSLRG